VGREAALQARGIVKTYRAPSGAPIPVLAGVDFTVAAGELAVIVGTSGSGKTTLLGLLGLLEEPEAGEVWFGGERVSILGRAVSA
jgi:ABC-type lipoprotein export system ATPase subunit